MLKILRAEIRRTFNHRSNLIFIGFTLLFSIIFLSFHFPSIFDENRERALTNFQANLAFPNSIFLTLSITYSFLFLLAPVITAYFIGTDYQSDTWKMILPRTSKRNLLLSCKILNLWIYLLLLFFISLILIHICSFVAVLWLKTSFIQEDVWQIPYDKQQKVLEIIFFAIWYVSLGTLLTIVSRSIIAGAMITFVVFIICNLISAYSPEIISIWFAPTHFKNLIPQPPSPIPIYEATRPTFSTTISWIVVITHIVVNSILSYFFLSRQDFSAK